MPSDKFSLSLPPGYEAELEHQASYWGFNRSEFIRVLFDAYLTVALQREARGLRDERSQPTSFPSVFPHRREQADQELREFAELVIRIHENAQARKQASGTVEIDTIYDSDGIEFADRDYPLEDGGPAVRLKD
jgi:hypothetical protein